MNEGASESPNSMPQPSASPPHALVRELGALERPIAWERLFGRTAPVEIEVGCGSGYFLSRYAIDHPELNLLGIDVVSSEVFRTQDKCRRLGALNVRLVRCDAPYFLHDYVAPATVQRFHVYYSDPWPKNRHHKRRLWKPEFIRLVARALAPGGELLLKTDVTAYYDVIQHAFAEADVPLTLETDRRIDREPLDVDYATNFQRKAIEKGHPLHYQAWRKQ